MGRLAGAAEDDKETSSLLRPHEERRESPRRLRSLEHIVAVFCVLIFFCVGKIAVRPWHTARPHRYRGAGTGGRGAATPRAPPPPPPPPTCDPCVPSQSSSRILFAIKTSSQPEYYERTQRLLAKYGCDQVENLVLITDAANSSNNDVLRCRLGSNARVVEVAGTEVQGAYHAAVGTAAERAFDLEIAQAAQRKSTRAAMGQLGEHDWLCYMDDDMVVNPAVLTAELQRLEPGCAAAALGCYVGDAIPAPGGSYRYSQGGWCADRRALEATQTALLPSGDWDGTDDVGLWAFLTDNGIELTNSPLWTSEWSVVHPDGTKTAYREPDYDDWVLRMRQNPLGQAAMDSLSVYGVTSARFNPFDA